MPSADVESISIEFPKLEPLFWKFVAFGERAVAAFALALVSPVLFLAMLSVTFLSRRSPLVAHRRVGEAGCAIWVLKLRTMWSKECDGRWLFVERLPSSQTDCQAPKAAGDPRVTHRFAALCRRFSVDELPQLWNVLQGEMALVGPRPLTSSELRRHYGPDAVEILTRRPGISGLWQITGRSRLSYAQRRRLDLFLVRNWSIALYCKILLVTLPKALTGKNAW